MLGWVTLRYVLFRLVLLSFLRFGYICFRYASFPSLHVFTIRYVFYSFSSVFFPSPVRYLLPPILSFQVAPLLPYFLSSPLHTYNSSFSLHSFQPLHARIIATCSSYFSLDELLMLTPVALRVIRG
jgi:hypothetical protein